MRIVGLLGGKGINGGDLSGSKSGYVCYLGRYKGWYSGLFGGYGGFGGSNCGYGGSDSGYQLGYGGYRGSNGGYGLEYGRQCGFGPDRLICIEDTVDWMVDMVTVLVKGTVEQLLLSQVEKDLEDLSTAK